MQTLPFVYQALFIITDCATNARYLQYDTSHLFCYGSENNATGLHHLILPE